MKVRLNLVGLVLTAQHRAAQTELAGPPLVPRSLKSTLSTCKNCERVSGCHVERYAACNIIQHNRFRGTSMMVWGCIYMEGRTDLKVLADSTLTVVRYRDKNPQSNCQTIRWCSGPWVPPGAGQCQCLALPLSWLFHFP